MSENQALQELSAQDLAFKNEFETAAAAGLTPEEFASTSEGRAKEEDIGRRADAYEENSVVLHAYSTAGTEEVNNSDSELSQSQIRAEEEERNEERNSQLRNLDEAAWDVEDGTGIEDGDEYVYNSLSPDAQARTSIGAKAPEHVVASFIRD